MEIEESAEQFSLQENRRLCIQLDYLRITPRLITAGIITQQETAQIQAEFVDNAGRMQEMISRLIKLNTEASFEAFREAVKHLGEAVLAQKLLRDQSTFGIPLNAEDAHLCLFTPTVLDNIFSFLGKFDLSIARLVCQRWNSVISAGHTNKFSARFRTHSGYKQMIEFGSTGLKSNFCKNLRGFVFDIRTIPKGAWIFYKSFFVEFGPKIQSLELGRKLDKDLLALIFSPETKQCLKNLRQLKLFVFPDKGLITDDSLDFLSQLETLGITNVSHEEKQQENCMHFLERFMESEHKLKALDFESDPIINRLPNANVVLPGLFKSSTLESLTTYGCRLDDAALRLTTVPNTEDRLKNIECILEIVSPEVFRDFILSHRRTLQRVSLIMVKNPNILEFLEVLPLLDSLTHFRLYTSDMDVLVGPISRLDFCNQAPNLKYLEVHVLGKQGLPQPKFVHGGLEELSLNFVYKSIPEGIREFITHVPHCFPNLTKLEVERITGQFAWPYQLGQLQLQAGSSEYSAKWERTGSAGQQYD